MQKALLQFKQFRYEFKLSTIQRYMQSEDETLVQQIFRNIQRTEDRVKGNLKKDFFFILYSDGDTSQIVSKNISKSYLDSLIEHISQEEFEKYKVVLYTFSEKEKKEAKRFKKLNLLLEEEIKEFERKYDENFSIVTHFIELWVSLSNTIVKKFVWILSSVLIYLLLYYYNSLVLLGVPPEVINKGGIMDMLQTLIYIIIPMLVPSMVGTCCIVLFIMGMYSFWLYKKIRFEKTINIILAIFIISGIHTVYRTFDYSKLSKDDINISNSILPIYFKQSIYPRVAKNSTTKKEYIIFGIDKGHYVGYKIDEVFRTLNTSKDLNSSFIKKDSCLNDYERGIVAVMQYSSYIELHNVVSIARNTTVMMDKNDSCAVLQKYLEKTF